MSENMVKARLYYKEVVDSLEKVSECLIEEAKIVEGRGGDANQIRQIAISLLTSANGYRNEMRTLQYL